MAVYGKLSLKDGLDISEKEFKAKLALAGYRGSVLKAWKEHSKTIVKKSPPKRKSRKTED